MLEEHERDELDAEHGRVRDERGEERLLVGVLGLVGCHLGHVAGMQGYNGVEGDEGGEAEESSQVTSSIISCSWRWSISEGMVVVVQVSWRLRVCGSALSTSSSAVSGMLPKQHLQYSQMSRKYICIEY